MQVGIYGGEAFPIYSVGTIWNDKIEVDDETLRRWKKAFEDFTTVQEEIVDQLNKQDKEDRVWFGGVWSGFNIEIDEELEKLEGAI